MASQELIYFSCSEDHQIAVLRYYSDISTVCNDSESACGTIIIMITPCFQALLFSGKS